MKKNIVLIGYRGTGKSTVASLLSERTGFPVFAMDKMIVERAGMEIPQIVEQEGWEGFRGRETALARVLGEKDGAIIDCGGGVVTRPENVAALRCNGVLVWLTADVDTIIERIRSSMDRPSLTGSASFVDEVPRVLEERRPLYTAAADLSVRTDGKDPAAIAEEILNALDDQEHG